MQVETIEEVTDLEGEESIGDSKEFSIYDGLVAKFTVSNPWLSEEYKEEHSNALFWGNQKTEKRISFPVVVELNDDEELDYDKIFIGSFNMDETIDGSEIVTSILYISEEEQIQATKDFLGEDYNEETLFEYCLSEIFESGKLDNYILENLDIEGKGEYENDLMILSIS